MVYVWFPNKPSPYNNVRMALLLGNYPLAPNKLSI